VRVVARKYTLVRGRLCTIIQMKELGNGKRFTYHATHERSERMSTKKTNPKPLVERDNNDIQNSIVGGITAGVTRGLNEGGELPHPELDSAPKDNMSGESWLKLYMPIGFTLTRETPDTFSARNIYCNSEDNKTYGHCICSRCKSTDSDPIRAIMRLHQNGNV
jgi:hypothetical protein